MKSGLHIRRVVAWAAMSAITLMPEPVASRGGCTSDAMLVFDGSGSMSGRHYGKAGEGRIVDARRAVRLAIPEAAKLRRIGLSIYGPSRTECTNVRLEFRPKENAGDAIVATIDRLEPTGGTPLTFAVEQAVEVLRHSSASGVVVLVTDGLENCGRSPCALAQRLASEFPRLKVHVIGFRLDTDALSQSAADETSRRYNSAQCLADLTGGLYRTADSVEDLAEALTQLLGCALVSRLENEIHLKAG